MATLDLQQKISVKQALKAFELVRQNGEHIDGEYALDGLFVSSDFDGYNLILRDARVKLFIFFHNTFECEYDSAPALDQFIERIARIIQHYEQH